MPFSIYRIKIYLGFGLVLLILSGIGLDSYRSINSLISTSASVTRSYQVLDGLTNLLSLIKDIENGQQGYVITRIEAYLEPYYAATRELDQKIKALRALIVDNPDHQSQFDTLESLLATKLALTKQQIELRRNEGFEVATHAAILTGEDKRVMDNIRQLIGEMQQAEDELLQQRSAETSANFKHAIFVIASGSLLAFGLVILAVLVVHHDLVIRNQAEEKLHQANSEFQVIFRALPDLFMRLDAAGTLLNYQAGHTFNLDLPAGTLIGRHLRDIFPPDISRQIEQAISQALKSDALITTEFSLSTPNGEQSFEVRISPLFNQQVVAIVRNNTESRRVEHALAEERNLLLTFVHNLPDYVYMKDTRSKFLLVNEPVVRLMGANSAEDMIGKNDFDFQPPELASQYFAREQVLLHSGQALVSHIEPALDRETGQQKWLLTTKVPFRDSQGRVAGLIGLNRDITEQKLAEAALSQQRAFLRQVIDIIPNHIFARDRQGRYTLVNQSTAKIGNMTVEDILGKTDADLQVDPEQAAKNRRDDLALMDAPQTETEPEIIQANFDDGAHWYQLIRRPLVDERGIANQVLGVATDITALKHAEMTLRESERKYRSVVDNIKEVIFQTDIDGLWTFLNPAWTGVTGFSIDESMGQSCLDYIHPDDRPPASELFQSLLNGDLKYYRYETRFLTKEGRIRWFEVYFQPTLAADESILGISGTLDDITERKRTEFLEKDRNHILEMISQNKPLSVVLETIVQLVERQFPDLIGSISLLENGRIYHCATPTLPRRFTRVAEKLSFDDIFGEQSLAASEGKIVMVNRITDRPKKDTYRQLALKHKLQSYWSAPILSSDGAMLGVFISYYRQPHDPIQVERQLVEMASRLAAIAIEHHQLTDQLAHQAQHDPLTSLPNRTLFEERLRLAITQARRSERLVGLLYVDLDRFKLVNDTLGHAAGDTLLREVTERLQGCVRAEDTVARIGGDEFTVVLTELENPGTAMQIAQRILAELKHPMTIRGHKLTVTASIGISLYPTDGTEADELLRRADSALYRCKEQGKNTCQFYTAKIDEVVQEYLRLKYQLQDVLERGELVLHYQPQYKANDGTLVGLEALLRWNHPQLGIVSPARFIPMAEENGLIIPIGAWVLAEACRQNQAWQKAGYPGLRMGVNVSVLQFARDDFVETVIQTLAKTGLEPKWLQLELTETLLMQDPQDTAAKLARLRDLGVVIAIDDFGTGYSSLTYLHQLPIDTLKIAQPFVREIGTDLNKTRRNEVIVTAVTNIAHSLWMKVVAEGVETEQQLEFLRRIGCNEIQGFLFSKPLSANQFEKLLKQETKKRLLLKNSQPRYSSIRMDQESAVPVG